MATSSPLLSLVKTIFIPAVISLVLFLLLTFVVLPVWRRYRNRYSQYLPVPSYTSGLSDFFSQRFSLLTLPSIWSRNGGSVDSVDIHDFMEDGEELDSVDPRLVNVFRQVITRRDDRDDHTRRLSRDLEEGFMDDSDDTDDN